MIEEERLFDPREDDLYFSKDTPTESVEQQVQNYLLDGRYKNHLSEIVGKWPGDESTEEILVSLD